ncbi:MAG: hypothetical protein KIT45_08910, partial [Fimbriimonadia bacterium]|nr:hypothetical protein [Fimbriimonadia bacterium]
QDPAFSDPVYSYCWNDPVGFVDPTGEIAWWIVAGIIIVGGIVIDELLEARYNDDLVPTNPPGVSETLVIGGSALILVGTTTSLDVSGSADLVGPKKGQKGTGSFSGRGSVMTKPSTLSLVVGGACIIAGIIDYIEHFTGWDIGGHWSWD